MTNGHAGRRAMLFGVLLGLLLAMVDNLIVAAAMPTVVRDLGGGDKLSWVVTAYTLAMAISTPLWGKGGDLRGRKLAFLSAVVVFVIGSALCGLSRSMPQLIAFRAVQGLGAGGLGVGAFAVIGDLMPPRERGRYQGMIGSVVAAGTIGGPLVGGLVTGHLGWRWAFYISVPLGLLCLVWTTVLLHLPARRRPVTIDWPGIALLTIGVGSVVLLTSLGGVRYAWTSAPIVVLSAAAVAALLLLIGWERRATEPVLPMWVFTNRNLGLSLMLAVVVGAIMYGAVLYLPLFQQTVQGVSAGDSGLLLVPMMIPVVLMSQVSGKLMSRTGRYKRWPVLGMAALTVGCLALSAMTTSTGRVMTAAGMVLLGAGLGCSQQMSTTIAQNSVGPDDIGVASGAITLFRSLGASLAVAVFGALFAHAVTGGAAGQPGYPALVVNGTHALFLAAAGICAVGFVAAAAVQQVELRSDPPPDPVPSTTARPALTL